MCQRQDNMPTSFMVICLMTLCLMKCNLSKDKPDTQYCKYNLTRKELKHLINRNKNSKELIKDIIRSVSHISSSRRKIDDISLCILKYISPYNNN